VLLADLRAENAKAAAEVLSNAGFEVSSAPVDVSSCDSIQELVKTSSKVSQRPTP
jgi:methylmalonyl-CoA mutase cobalamin-binding subunit